MTTDIFDQELPEEIYIIITFLPKWGEIMNTFHQNTIMVITSIYKI